MSRQLSVRRSRRPRSSPAIRSLSFEEEEAVDDPRPSTSRGVPRLRDAPDPLLYTFCHSSDEECGDSEEEYTPPAKHRRTKDHSDPHFGDDSDWEGSDSKDESELSDCESEEDFVPLDDTSLDYDENLAEYVRRRWARTAPGISSFVWRKRENEPRRFDFTTAPGVKVPDLDAESTPEEVFRQFLMQELYVAQNPRTRSAHTKGWEDTTVKEVRTYLGLRFLMGLQSKRQMRVFWSRDPLMSSAIFPQTMSRDRFDQLTAALHFTDSQAERQADDRLWKLRPVVDVLDRQFREVFVPNKVVSIDESLWAFKERHQALQFVPNKRARRGIKVYKLCSSLGPEAGYTTAFRIYMGKDRGDVPASMKR
ncbi:piggyBac transposase Uribo2 [Penaeus vannamei]|uniref:PiggyBac transposase Uribo2 n=1 Tax=Penaeus vannamei TaxID=6689 RepID=A0A423TRZ1_PENVA|nr:piggyBac transposase Uribo2 [Penaeus vannamei]